jgi:hypothetical protein
MMKDKKLKLSNLRPESRDITLYKKIKNNYEVHISINPTLNDEIEKKSI